VRGVDVNPEADMPQAASDLAAAYVIEAPDAAAATAHFHSRGVRVSRLGRTRTDDRFVLKSESTTVAALDQAWRGG
jgi:hypothetical protein